MAEDHRDTWDSSLNPSYGDGFLEFADPQQGEYASEVWRNPFATDHDSLNFEPLIAPTDDVIPSDPALEFWGSEPDPTASPWRVPHVGTASPPPAHFDERSAGHSFLDDSEESSLSSASLEFAGPFATLPPAASAPGVSITDAEEDRYDTSSGSDALESLPSFSLEEFTDSNVVENHAPPKLDILRRIAQLGLRPGEELREPFLREFTQGPRTLEHHPTTVSLPMDEQLTMHREDDVLSPHAIFATEDLTEAAFFEGKHLGGGIGAVSALSGFDSSFAMELAPIDEDTSERYHPLDHGTADTTTAFESPWLEVEHDSSTSQSHLTTGDEPQQVSPSGSAWAPFESSVSLVPEYARELDTRPISPVEVESAAQQDPSSRFERETVPESIKAVIPHITEQQDVSTDGASVSLNAPQRDDDSSHSDSVATPDIAEVPAIGKRVEKDPLQTYQEVWSVLDRLRELDEPLDSPPLPANVWHDSGSLPRAFYATDDSARRFHPLSSQKPLFADTPPSRGGGPDVPSVQLDAEDALLSVTILSTTQTSGAPLPSQDFNGEPSTFISALPQGPSYSSQPNGERGAAIESDALHLQPSSEVDTSSSAERSPSRFNDSGLNSDLDDHPFFTTMEIKNRAHELGRSDDESSRRTRRGKSIPEMWSPEQDSFATSKRSKKRHKG